MYFEQAVNRINAIDWNNVGKKYSKEDEEKGCEFLKRLASFYNETLSKRYPPLVSNIAKILGDNSEEDFTQYYSDRSNSFFRGNAYQSKVFEYYLQLSRYAEENIKAKHYIYVYEPLIELCEKGGSFHLRKNELEIEGVVSISLSNWFDKFSDLNN